MVSMLVGLAAAKTAILMNKEAMRVKIVFILFDFQVHSKLNSGIWIKPFYVSLKKTWEENVKEV
jgi:hypothetical protein